MKNSDFTQWDNSGCFGPPVQDKDKLYIDSDDDRLIDAMLLVDAGAGSWKLTWNEPKLRIWRRERENTGDVDENGNFLYNEFWTQVDNGINVPVATAGETIILKIEGVAASETWGDITLTASFIPENDGGMVIQDSLRVTVADIDVDVDSDNNSGFEVPQNTADTLLEDFYEDKANDPKYPGKLVRANIVDKNNDMIPDFHNIENCREQFVPLVVRVPACLDLNKARMRFTYNSSIISNKMCSQIDGSIVTNPPNPVHFNFTPEPGNLRIWKKDGGGADKRDVTGDFIPSGTDDTLAKFGFTDLNRSGKVFYVEGVRPGASQADQRILVEIDPDGDGPAGWIMSDAVRMSCVWVEFKPNANTTYGFDKGGDVFPVDDYNGVLADMRKYGPLHDYVSVAREKTTQIDAVISGVLPQYIKFSDKPNVFTITPKAGADQTQTLTITGAAIDKSFPERLEAQDPSGTPINFLEVLTYKKMYYGFTLYNVKHGTPGMQDIVHDNLSVEEINSFVNDKLKSAVAEATIQLPNGQTTPTITIPYDLNKNGVVDVVIGAECPFQEKNLIKQYCHSDDVLLPDGTRGMTTPIIHIHDVLNRYSLSEPTLNGGTTITLICKTPLFVNDKDYKIMGPTTTSNGKEVCEDVKIRSQSIDAQGRMVVTFYAPLNNEFLAPQAALVYVNLGGQAGTCDSIKAPIWITDSNHIIDANKTLEGIKETMAHEIGHTMTNWNLSDLKSHNNLMYWIAESLKDVPDSKMLRYRELPLFYTDPDQSQRQWDCFIRGF